jgi:hypothetical protein
MQYMAVIATRLPPYDAAPSSQVSPSRFYITVDEEIIPLQRIWRAKAATNDRRSVPPSELIYPCFKVLGVLSMRSNSDLLRQRPGQLWGCIYNRLQG